MNSKEIVVLVSIFLMLGLGVPFRTFAQGISQQQVIEPSGTAEEHLGFGNSIDVYGKHMIVGGGLNSTDEFGASSVYFFEDQNGVWTESQRIQPEDASMVDYVAFGRVVSMHGDLAAVSAREVFERYEPELPDDVGYPKTFRGVIFVFQLVDGTWIEMAKLNVDHLANSPNETAGLDSNLSLHERSLAAGPIRVHGPGGPVSSVAVFNLTEQGWALQDQVVAPCLDCTFGNALAIYADTLAVSSIFKNSVNDGSVYIYERVANEWQLESELVPADGALSRSFGNRMSLYGDSLLVGAVRDYQNGVMSGSAYEFELIGGVWVETNKITPQVSGPYQFFSYWLDHSGDTAVISEYRAYSGTPPDPDYFEHHEVSVFKKSENSWTEVGYLEKEAGDELGWFGHRVATKGNSFAVSYQSEDRVWMFAYSPPTNNVTSAGENIEVVPTVTALDGEEVEGAPEFNFTYENIEVSGETTITVIDPSPESTTPPSGFSILGLDDSSALFDFHTTATLAEGSTVEICIDYSAMDINGDPADLIFAHEVDGVWLDITSSNDVGQEIICGVTDSFSYFALLEVADPVELLAGLVQAVAALNAKHGIVNSLDAKLDAAQQALTDARENNDHSAINVLMHSFVNAVEAQRGNQILEAEADLLIGLAMEIIEVIEGNVTL